MKTYNRGKLLRLARTGKLVAVESYDYDDMHGESRMEKGEKTVHVLSIGEWGKDGFFNVHESDFKSHGRAWENENGTITLYVHSNCNYTFREVKP